MKQKEIYFDLIWHMILFALFDIIFYKLRIYLLFVAFVVKFDVNSVVINMFLN